MTTYFDFAPSQQAPFQFQPTLDGQLYNAVVTWNLFGQRWYLNLYDLSGNLIFCQSLVGSLSDLPLSSISWGNGTVTIVTEEPHTWPVGLTTDLVIGGCAPDAYNGTYQMLVVDGSTLTYALTVDPGVATAIGTVGFEVNLAAGYFDTSTLVYSDADMQFQVTP